MPEDQESRKNGENTADGRFQPGNPGRPRGARHKVTRAIEELLEGQHEALTRKAIEKALEGDNIALRLCLERLAPARKDSPVSVDLPTVKTAEEAVDASAAVLAAVGCGDITPAPAEGSYAKIMDLGDAIHLATAALHQVDEFHTRDDDDRKTKIPLLSLYAWAGEDRLCGRYDLKIVSPESAQGEFDVEPKAAE